MEKVVVIDRKNKKRHFEKIYGSRVLNLFYGKKTNTKT